jgi:hypothetical protein
LELLERVRAFTPERRKAALEATRASITPEERTEIEIRQRQHEKLSNRLAATETLEEQQQQLADELYPRFDAWVRTRNQIKARLARAPRLVAIIRPRPRGAGKPRAQAARSSAASGDSGDPDLDDPPGGRAHPYSGVAA